MTKHWTAIWRGIGLQLIGGLVLGASWGDSEWGFAVAAILISAGFYLLLVGLIAAGVRMGNEELLAALRQHTPETANSRPDVSALGSPTVQPATEMPLNTILGYLRDQGPSTVDQIAAGTDLPAARVRITLAALEKNRHVKWDGPRASARN